MLLIIPGTPVSQARMRGTARGGFVRMYDPKAREKEEIRAKLKTCMKQDYPNLSFPKYPRVSFVFCMPIPKSVRKKELSEYQSGLKKHIIKPDCDNLVKLYLDCLTGISIECDEAVSLGGVIKVYSTEPKTIIQIQETAGIVHPLPHHDLDFLESSKLTSAEKDCLFCSNILPQLEVPGYLEKKPLAALAASYVSTLSSLHRIVLADNA